jgi:alkylation response protein AidB-like acyl-CoA dehydrogenase
MRLPMNDVSQLLAGVDRRATNTVCIADGMARLQTDLAQSDPHDLEGHLELLGRLYGAGRFDLALGRLFEGHIDALQIIARYGHADGARHLHDMAREGARFGVWNAPLSGEPLRLRDGVLDGGKAFASGAGLLTHAVVTAEIEHSAHKQLLVIDLEHTPPMIDRDWWQVLGMQRSETHLVRWDHTALGERDMILGAPGDYEREPWLSAGALRFVSVQAGGIAGLFDGVRAHLVERSRADDPHQVARLGQLYGLADSAAAICRRTAGALYDSPVESHPARVASARSVVLDAGERALTLAQQCVGLSAFFETDPLCRHMADLMVYLRQPAPDAQRVKAGAAAASQDIGLSL